MAEQRAQALGGILAAYLRGVGTQDRRAARRGDVDEPEQRRAELAVAGGEIQCPRVERPQRVAGAGGKRPGQLGADPTDLGLELPRSGAGHQPTVVNAGAVSRSMASQPESRWRSRSSAAPPPRTPNRRLA